MGTGDVAKYPFLDEAGEYAKKLNIDIWSDEQVMTQILERAASRIRVAVLGEIYTDLQDHRVELLTFVSCLILVKMLNNDKLLKRYALMEARRVEKFLEAEMKEQTTMPMVLQILSQQFSVPVKQASGLYTISVPQFLMHAQSIKTEHWKLINQSVSNGQVYMEHYKVIRLLREEVQKLIMARVKNLQLPKDLHLFQPTATILHQQIIPKFQAKVMLVSEYPPCVAYILKSLNEGINISHTGRLFLANYLVAIGKSEDEVVEAFRNAPDFNEKITRGHVSGVIKRRESGVEFSVTGCEKLNFNSLCFRTDACGEIKNPMQFKQVRA